MGTGILPMGSKFDITIPRLEPPYNFSARRWAVNPDARLAVPIDLLTPQLTTRETVVTMVAC